MEILEGRALQEKLKKLKEVKKENWIIYYIDEATNEKWVKEYFQSEYHGGGTPVLRQLNKFPWEI